MGRLRQPVQQPPDTASVTVELSSQIADADRPPVAVEKAASVHGFVRIPFKNPERLRRYAFIFLLVVIFDLALLFVPILIQERSSGPSAEDCGEDVILDSPVISTTLLDLQDRKITGDCAKYLRTLFKSLPRLSNLDMSNSRLDARAFSIVAKGLRRLSSLEILRLQFGRPPAESEVSFAAALKTLSKLRIIRIDFQHRWPCGAFGWFLENMPGSLEEIQMLGMGPTCPAEWENIARLRNLQHLTVSVEADSLRAIIDNIPESMDSLAVKLVGGSEVGSQTVTSPRHASRLRDVDIRSVGPLKFENVLASLQMLPTSIDKLKTDYAEKLLTNSSKGELATSLKRFPILQTLTLRTRECRNDREGEKQSMPGPSGDTNSTKQFAIRCGLEARIRNLRDLNLPPDAFTCQEVENILKLLPPSLLNFALDDKCAVPSE